MNRKIIKYSGWALAAIFVLVLAARIMLAPLAGSAIENWFENQGVTADIDELSFELMDGHASLDGLKASAGGNQVLALGHIEIAWSWSDLSDHLLRIDAIRIDGLDLQTERLEDGRMIVAGIDLSSDASAAQSDANEEPGEPLDWALALSRFEMTGTRLCYRETPKLDFCNQLQNLDWQGNLHFDLAKLGAEGLPLRADGKFDLAGFESQNNDLQRVLANFDDFAFEGIAVDGENIAIESITLESLNLFQRIDSGDSGFIEQLDRLRVNDLRLESGSLLTVAEILIEGNATEFVKPESDRYEIDAWLAALGQAPSKTVDTQAPPLSGDDTPENREVSGRRQPDKDAIPEIEQKTDAPKAQPEQTQTANAAESQPGRSFEFAVGKLIFETEKPLLYRDLSLDKPFVVGLSSARLVVESLDSRQPDSPSKITYEAKLDGDSLFEIAGTITPLATRISFDLAGEIKALDLRQLSPFTAAKIGHTIKSGQLDADIDLRAEQAVMNGEIDLVLYHFNLEELSEADAEAMEAQFGFPLNTGLSLLKNRAGNIELKVPLTGDIQNAEFGSAKIITRELSKAITSAVLTFYTPFGLVSAADALFSLATALKFEPVTFGSGTSELGAVQHGELDRIATLMQERPGIQLRLCPFTNTADRLALLPDSAELSAEDVRPGDMPEIGALGEARIAAVERYLAGKQIDPARLVPCASTHVEGEGLARIEISI